MNKSKNLFAESHVEGWQGGPVEGCEFNRLTDICIEFDNVLYVCDAHCNEGQ